MSRVLLVPFPPAGHAEPMAVLGDRLRVDGHEVTVFAESPQTRWGLGRPVPPQLYASGDSNTLYRHLFLGDVAGMARDVADLAAACGAELIVADVMMPGGALAAELRNLPFVSLSCCPVPTLSAYRTFIAAHTVAAFDPASTRTALGLPAGGRNLLGLTSATLHLIPTTDAVAGHPELPAEVALVGPLVAEPGPRREPDGPPVVVVAASTHTLESLGARSFVQERYLAAAVAALGGLDVTGLVTRQPQGTPPANVRFLGAAPHDALFDAAAAVVTHGGWGTVSKALVRGLPMVLVPLSGDQPYIAGRCADLGLGLALDAETVTAAGLRDAVRAVVEEPRFRKAAAELAAELRAAAPAATASALVTSMPASEG
ncbi:glycosyltransferase [Dactylosporangium sp. CA-233914]|uniref:glycosyltransferase n=1 Tax=Dactylosporangium sp. CA-233914 TaxID=3239934 RepID=UPI003D8EB3D8